MVTQDTHQQHVRDHGLQAIIVAPSVNRKYITKQVPGIRYLEADPRK